MSVHEDLRPDGTIAYVVRWREDGRQRGKRFSPKKLGGKRAAKRAAEIFDGYRIIDADRRRAARGDEMATGGDRS